ncbi:UdgX family uracil-DNA binding protein [Streptomyces sp. FXJ1.172]|uniref:UdgX family uracil-DNA binding protein n=1 Tax=Streptomyces sp. FXJ1.172 TaxID=710705 RepID=UPI0007CF962F|nr:UdgX family uracil-DNA binding protein [Streptomyces sp. FXJ1.172]WEO99657.1 UdgX family uracil-DNA binding protein [Streptomyces sp. FXJ1.172]
MAGTDTEVKDASGHDATPFLPGRRAGLPGLRKAAARCQGCPLYREATQTVFGEGDTSARVLLLGEQPGDQEDRQGRPFVGPAGKVLRRALADAGIDPERVYVTNAVKHFKFTIPEGRKRRIHKAPNLREMTACRPWLVAELRVVSPEVVVALGGTAGKALLGSGFRVTEQRGMLLSWPGLGESGEGDVDADAEGEGHGERSGTGEAEEGIRALVATIHPSAVLRADDADRTKVYDGLVGDLRLVADLLAESDSDGDGDGDDDGHARPGEDG